jgi:hypothetical protein
VVLPLYRATLTLYGALTLLIAWICLHLVQPKGRRGITRADTIMLIVVAFYLLGAYLARDWWGAGLRPPEA